jgi:hypothetical protein
LTKESALVSNGPLAPDKETNPTYDYLPPIHTKYKEIALGQDLKNETWSDHPLEVSEEYPYC